ncbi:hypothetical protein CAC42_8207 [Sphaceloma murrayae]|uniref:Uncharacterized protein n=1 Tax=Sphaceloma murrayae TaxID=2082308 RepID=A0A2K1QJ81_9PEZI|nr:hypothetical protein CAC42_8207 [Sphaceloma murrayae]
MTSRTTVLQDRPRALQQINLNAIYTSDQGTSSEEDLSQLPRHSQSDVQSLVGISLGPEQLRLNSPATPAVEKVAAIEAADGFFGPGDLAKVAEDDEPEDIPKTDGQDDRGRQETPQRSPPLRHQLPSPWRTGPRVFQRAEDPRTSSKDAASRKRSSSGAAISATLDSWQKSFMSSIPSLPKALTFSSHFSPVRSSITNSKSTSPERRAGNLPVPDRQPLVRARSKSEANALEIATQLKAVSAGTPGSTGDSSVRPPLPHTKTSELRRTTSDQSLRTNALSRVSTLGDDSRFEHVSAQVNSRAKAIRDSLQDSNFKLPSLSSFSLDSFRPDFAVYNNRNGLQKKPVTGPTLDQESGLRSTTRLGQFSPTPDQTAKNRHFVGDRRDGGPSAKVAVTHPHFTKACAEMTGDVVVLGGYRGSILRSADPPHIQLWAPVKVGLGIRKVDLEIGLNVPEDDRGMESKIIPGGMLSHIGPVDISKRLFRRLRACENAQSGKLRVHDYGYDWRLDPHYLSERLIQYLESLPCNKPGTPKAERGATVIAHSLGGLITRHAVNQRPELFAGVVYAGTPSTCVNILGPLRAGDDVLLSSRVLTAQVNFTIRTSFALLPLDGKCFFNKDTKEEFPLDFFDPQTWLDNRLSPCLARALPAIDAPPPSMVESLMSSISNSLPSFNSSRRASLSQPSSKNASSPDLPSIEHNGPALEPGDMDGHPTSSVSTHVTISRDAAMKYLTVMLARVKKFKMELDHVPSHRENNLYPAQAVIYGKSTPTVYGAKVKDRDQIRRTNAYDSLAFASGDGVVLARAAMLPQGYEAVRGGVICSERGHITLLGDLEAVGRALNAVRRARAKGTGMGL